MSVNRKPNLPPGVTEWDVHVKTLRLMDESKCTCCQKNRAEVLDYRYFDDTTCKYVVCRECQGRDDEDFLEVYDRTWKRLKKRALAILRARARRQQMRAAR